MSSGERPKSSGNPVQGSAGNRRGRPQGDNGEPHVERDVGESAAGEGDVSGREVEHGEPETSSEAHPRPETQTQPQRHRPRPRRGEERRNGRDTGLTRSGSGTGLALQDMTPYAIHTRSATRTDVGKRCAACNRHFLQIGEDIRCVRGRGSLLLRYHRSCIAAAGFPDPAGGVGGTGGSGGGQAGAGALTALGPGALGQGLGGRALVLAYLAAAEEPETGPGGESGRAQRPQGAQGLPQDPSRSGIYTTGATGTGANGGGGGGLAGAHEEDEKAKVCAGLGLDDLVVVCNVWRLPDAEARALPGECPICLRDFSPPEGSALSGPEAWISEPVLRFPCSTHHVFHAACATPWLRKAGLCPTCRVGVKPFLSTSRRPPSRTVPSHPMPPSGDNQTEQPSLTLPRIPPSGTGVLIAAAEAVSSRDDAATRALSSQEHPARTMPQAVAPALSLPSSIVGGTPDPPTTAAAAVNEEQYLRPEPGGASPASLPGGDEASGDWTEWQSPGSQPGSAQPEDFTLRQLSRSHMYSLEETGDDVSLNEPLSQPLVETDAENTRHSDAESGELLEPQT